MDMVDIRMSVYAVRSKYGKWFRSKGYGGYGDSWVDDIKKAKTYTKLSSARSVVSWWSNNYPAYGIPDIVEWVSDNGIILDEDNRVSDAKHKRDVVLLKRRIRSLEYSIREDSKEADSIRNKVDTLNKEYEELVSGVRVDGVLNSQ